MKSFRSIKALGVLLSIFLSFGITGVQADEISNGGFENGDFSGWSVLEDEGFPTGCGEDDSESCGQWFVLTSGEVEAAEGDSFALWNVSGPSWGVLAREFDNSTNSNQDLTLRLIYWNGAGQWATDNQFPYGLGADNEEEYYQNQWLKVDVLRAGSELTTLDPEEILYTAFDGLADNAASESDGWLNITIDHSFLPAGTFIFRVVTVNNIFFFNVGIDDVQYVESSVDPLFAQDARFNSMVSSCRRDFTTEIRALIAPSLSEYQACMFLSLIHI